MQTWLDKYIFPIIFKDYLNEYLHYKHDFGLSLEYAHHQTVLFTKFFLQIFFALNSSSDTIITNNFKRD